MNMGTDSNKVALVILPIILTALVAVIGFLVMQIIDLKSEIGDIKTTMATNHGNLSIQLGRQEVTVRNLSAKIDAITVIKVKED